MSDAEIPTDFPLRDMMEEVAATITSRQQMLDGKIERGKMGGPEANLARYSIARLKSVWRYLRDVREAMGDETVLPLDVIPAWLEEAHARVMLERQEAAAAMAAMREPAKVDEKPAEPAPTLPPEPQPVEEALNSLDDF